MVYRTLWTEQAIEDLREISEFLARRNPQAALKFGAAIFARVERLPAFPFMGRMVPEIGRNNLREIIYGSYRIFYRVIEATRVIEILRVWHAARGEPDIAI
jgi:toxin ParE1/3/4